MSCILHIETSTAVCSVAVSEDGQNIFVKEDLKGPSHAVSLGVFVDEALSFIDSHAIPLDAVAAKSWVPTKWEAARCITVSSRCLG